MYSTRTYIPAIKTLENLPLEALATDYERAKARLGIGDSLASETKDILERFALNFSIKKNAEWFFGQMLAEFANIPLKPEANGRYSAKTLFLEHIKKDQRLLGLWLIARHPKRFLEKQSDARFKNFCGLVPLIMSAFKKYKKIQYSEWDHIEGITDPNLAAAMAFRDFPEITKEEVLADRTYALTNRSTGAPKDPISTYMLPMHKDSKMHELPPLIKIMMCQTWCAHPLVRTEYMILNPLDWDSIPEPLIDAKPLKEDYRWDV